MFHCIKSTFKKQNPKGKPTQYVKGKRIAILFIKMSNQWSLSRNAWEIEWETSRERREDTQLLMLYNRENGT